MLIDIFGIVLSAFLFVVGAMSVVTKRPIGLGKSPKALESKESATKLARISGTIEIILGIIVVVLNLLRNQEVLDGSLVAVIMVTVIFELLVSRYFVLYMIRK